MGKDWVAEGSIRAVGAVLASQNPATVLVTVTVFVNAPDVAVTVIDDGSSLSSVSVSRATPLPSVVRPEPAESSWPLLVVKRTAIPL